MNINRKYLRPSEVEEIYGIKQGTLAKQRSHGFGLPYVIIGRKPKKRKGGIVLYDIEDLEKHFKTINKVGDEVRVKFSPFDMSKGELVL